MRKEKKKYLSRLLLEKIQCFIKFSILLKDSSKHDLLTKTFQNNAKMYNFRIDKFFLKAFPGMFVIFNIMYWLLLIFN